MKTLAFIHIAWFAMVLMGQNPLSETDQSHNKAWGVDYRNAVLYFETGWELAQKKKADEASVFYQKALALQPGYGDAHFGLASLILDRDPARAEEQLRAALSGGTQHAAVAHNVLGNLLNRKGLMDQAIAHFRESVNLDNSQLEARYNLGLALRRKGLASEAEALFKEVLALDPNHILAHLQVGRFSMGRKDFAGASQHFTKMLDINPNSPFAWYNLGLAHEGMDQFEDALANYRKALALKSDLNAAGRSLAWLLATCPKKHLRNGEEAVTLAENLCRATGYRNPLMLDALAAGLAVTGQYQKAVDTAKQALGLTKNPQLVKEITARIGLYEQGKPFLRM